MADLAPAPRRSVRVSLCRVCGHGSVGALPVLAEMVNNVGVERKSMTDTCHFQGKQSSAGKGGPLSQWGHRGHVRDVNIFYRPE